MRRLLGAGCAAAVIAVAAACGNGNGNGNGYGDGDQGDQAAGSTPEVCAQAQMVELETQQQLQEELFALEAEEMEQGAFEEEAVELTRNAFLGWSQGLRAPAEQADDQQLANALTDLADGLEDAAPQLNVESLQTGQLPEEERLNEAATELTRLCPTPTPQPPMNPPGDPEAPGSPQAPASPGS